MKSIREILSNLASQEPESIEKSIAKAIMKDYDKGIFKNQTEIAKEAYVSESALTKFSKKIGYAGWKEFYYNLKIEYKKYYLEFDENINKDNFVLDEMVKFNAYIHKESQFLNNLSNEIFLKKKVIMFSGYQMEVVTDYFNDLLVELDIEVTILKNRNLFRKLLERNLDDYVLVMILTGNDNNFLVEHYELLDQNIKTNNLFVISSNSQKHKVTAYRDLFVLTSFGGYSGYKFRRIFIEYFFLNVYYLLKTF
ncbi:MurR/RpiR family transcriptional regulator [Spiroplasma culicicola]|uniref:HTH rpiR-type domain-containing protein n=1 Tax=Spiroplasma culicicola AES-1 TaxID=1276246 RepID=W6A7D4_9MOLU|nr:MurR/RpiR family transcriptional regulator [Spiroplasma culicicola]AHI52750.1 hypothetical protein SCULI_v1c04090 [Spiroplasma culicicola AES-1]